VSVTSLSFYAFVLVCWASFVLLRSSKQRLILLLLASYVFYATWALWFVAILIASSVMNWLLGRFIKARPTTSRLWVGVALNLGLLAVFKYLPPVFHKGVAAGILHSLIMPVGISFWTFQALSYLFDVYREEEMDPTLTEFCAYLAFWPTVLSGPVTRLPEMLPQLRALRTPVFDDDIACGCRRIVVGLFMKVGVAQILANGLLPGQGLISGFDQITKGWGGIDVWVLAVGYGFQLFFDFAGYTNIVIGVASLFGIQLPENFRSPYLSTSASAFWTRWHMSLSFWIRDYLFLPLAMARSEQAWRYFALFFSMVIFGLWHGAALTFICWGAYHGLLLVVHRQWQGLVRRWGWEGGRILDLLGWAVTFGAVSLGWIMFRVRDMQQAILMYRAALSVSAYHRLILDPNLYVIVFGVTLGYFAVCGITSLYRRMETRAEFSRTAWILSPTLYAFMLIVVILWSSGKTVFVYFQF
jgi:alginate O-acetyltransferase complex protein AlgI